MKAWVRFSRSAPRSLRGSNPTYALRLSPAGEKQLGRTFTTIVRPIEDLEAVLPTKPFDKFNPPVNAKRNVTVLRNAPKTFGKEQTMRTSETVQRIVKAAKV